MVGATFTAFEIHNILKNANTSQGKKKDIQLNTRAALCKNHFIHSVTQQSRILPTLEVTISYCRDNTICS